MHRRTSIIFVIVICLLGVASVTAENSIYLSSSQFDQSAVAIKYALAGNSTGSIGTVLAADESFSIDSEQPEGFKKKSPGKAFALSLLVPGLGQYYNGSKIKPALFLSAEIAAWVMYFKFDGEGNDLTDEFEAFNRAHWSETDYSDFLFGTYGVGDDDSVSNEHIEINHHLPDTKTQQYYEMTGKYNQFSWGWDDALLNDSTLADYLNGGGGPPPVNDAQNIPYSGRRLAYEDMRNEANNKFDTARRMVYISILNRLVSGFEAMMASKKHNRGKENQTDGNFLSRVRIEPKFKSYNESLDTPYISCKVRF